jgi:hypothetical protein
MLVVTLNTSPLEECVVVGVTRFILLQISVIRYYIIIAKKEII